MVESLKHIEKIKENIKNEYKRIEFWILILL